MRTARLFGLAVMLLACVSVCIAGVDPACEEDWQKSVQKIRELSAEGLARLEEAAMSGDPEAQLAWGRTFGFGIGKREDLRTAREWYTKAAEAGNCPAQMILADWNLFNKVGADPVEAYKWNLKLAERGLWWAQINVGSALMMGRGVAKDEKKGFEWILKSADENESPNGQLAVAGAYMQGQGVERDLDKAEAYARRALENGISLAQRLIESIQSMKSGILPPVPDFKAELKTAQTGDAVAQYSVGQSYRTGRTVPQNLPEALKWLGKSATQGFPLAKAALGEMFEEGLGVQQDSAAAAKLFEDASTLGVRRAQFRLAGLYYKGSGVQADLVKSCMLYAIAARRGDKEAPLRKHQVCSELTAEQRDSANKLVKQFFTDHPDQDEDMGERQKFQWVTRTEEPERKKQ